jgi:cytochrome c oxidase cbb3-type subunit 2
MPRYAHLFRDDRGEDLIAFLSAVPEGSLASRVEVASAWLPSGTHPADSLPVESGSSLFHQLCAACHGADGRGNGELAARLTRPPSDLVLGPLPHTGNAWPPDERRIRLLRAVKFGIPGTDMPGHETLEDREIAALSDFVLELRKPGTPASP